jgi:tetratricopeptide (TPR) repeat protein
MRALAGLKHAYLMQRQPGMAVQKVKEYASQQPKSASVQQFLGYMLWAVGDRAAARAAFQTAKAADPQSRHSDLALVQLDAMDSKWDDAAGRLKTLVASQPADATAHLWLGNVEMVRKNPAAALEHFRRAVEAAPGHAQSLNNFAYLLSEHANKPDEALKHAEKALELDPDHPVYAGTLGWILYRKGLYPSAVKYLERAASAAKDPVIKYHLAMAYAKNGARQQGQAVFADALKRNPDLPEATIAREVLASAK